MRLGPGLALKLTTIDLGEIIKHIVEETAVAYPEHRMEWQTQGIGDLVGDWDGDRVSQALSNLLTNAVHGEDPVTIDVVHEGASVIVEVRNNGHIPTETACSSPSPKPHRSAVKVLAWACSSSR
jgi:signal transduction histidine kinase